MKVLAHAAAMLIISVALALFITNPAGSAPRAESPIKAFVDAPDGYSNIIAGCIGKNGWYSNQSPGAELVITLNDPNCLPGGALRP